MVATPECSRRSLSLCHCHVHISSVYLEILDHQGRLVTLLEQSNYTLTITIEIDSGIEKNQQKFPINPALLICQFLQLERHSLGTTKLQRSHNHPIIRLSIACHKSWQISTMQFTLLQCGKRKTIWS